MLNLYQKVQKIESLQAEADKATASFKKRYDIDCQEYCSECCQYDDINATPLEFLPLAWHSYKTGQLEQLFQKVSETDSKKCVFLTKENGKWGCTCYPSRGMICRLFGFSSIKDKHGKCCFAECKTLKKCCPDKTKEICEMIHNGSKTPVISDFYRKLSTIDMTLENELVPINQAIKEACEIVYLHTAYK